MLCCTEAPPVVLLQTRNYSILLAAASPLGPTVLVRIDCLYMCELAPLWECSVGMFCQSQ